MNIVGGMEAYLQDREVDVSKVPRQIHSFSFVQSFTSNNKKTDSKHRNECKLHLTN